MSRPWRIAALLAIASYQRAGGPTEQTTPIVEELTDRPPRTFAQFARDHPAEFRADLGDRDAELSQLQV